MAKCDHCWHLEQRADCKRPDKQPWLSAIKVCCKCGDRERQDVATPGRR